MSKVWLAPTGSVVEGHVLDVAKKPFERALKDYDSQLYVRWNPKKLKGWGCWEIRRKPESQTIVDFVEWKGTTVFKLGYREVDLVANILDCAFLNYDQLRKIREMDTWQIGPKQWLADRDYAEKQHKAAITAKRKEELKYAAKEYKREIRDFKEFVLSGNNPHLISQYWDKADS